MLVQETWLVDVMSTDRHPQTALHFVASKKNLDVARLLIENKASARVRDRRGQYAIHRAAAVGSDTIISLLLRNRSPLNATDGEGFTPLHHAIAEGHGRSLINCSRGFPLRCEIMKLMLFVGDTAVALLKEGADFTMKNSEDMVALDLAPDKEVNPRCIADAKVISS